MIFSLHEFTSIPFEIQISNWHTPINLFTRLKTFIWNLWTTLYTWTIVLSDNTRHKKIKISYYGIENWPSKRIWLIVLDLFKIVVDS